MGHTYLQEDDIDNDKSGLSAGPSYELQHAGLSEVGKQKNALKSRGVDMLG